MPVETCSRTPAEQKKMSTNKKKRECLSCVLASTKTYVVYLLSDYSQTINQGELDPVDVCGPGEEWTDLDNGGASPGDVRRKELEEGDVGRWATQVK